MDVEKHSYLKPYIQMFCLVFIVLVSVPGHVVGGPTLLTREHQLSVSPGSLLISLDFQGGQTPRTNTDPHLVITSDGMVFLGSPYGISKPIKTQISRCEIQDI